MPQENPQPSTRSSSDDNSQEIPVFQNPELNFKVMCALENMENPKEGSLQYYFIMFKTLRYSFLDDLPAQRITPSDPNYYLYKCRGNWLACLRGHLENAIDSDRIFNDRSIVERIEKFIERFLGKGADNTVVTRQEINEVNQLLDEVIAYLEPKHNLLLHNS